MDFLQFLIPCPLAFPCPSPDSFVQLPCMTWGLDSRLKVVRPSSDDLCKLLLGCLCPFGASSVQEVFYLGQKSLLGFAVRHRSPFLYPPVPVETEAQELYFGGKTFDRCFIHVHLKQKFRLYAVGTGNVTVHWQECCAHDLRHCLPPDLPSSQHSGPFS